MLPQRLFQLLGRLQDILLSKHPRTPMHTQRLSTLGILEYLHRVVRIGVHGTHDPSREIRSDGNQAQVEGSTVVAYVFEGGTGGEVVFRGMVVDVVGEFWDGSVACVAVVWFFLVPTTV